MTILSHEHYDVDSMIPHTLHEITEECCHCGRQQVFHYWETTKPARDAIREAYGMLHAAGWCEGPQPPGPDGAMATFCPTCKDDPEVWRIYHEVYRIQAERDFRREQDRESQGRIDS